MRSAARSDGVQARIRPNPFVADEHELALPAARAGMRYPALIQRIVDEAVAR